MRRGAATAAVAAARNVWQAEDLGKEENTEFRAWEMPSMARDMKEAEAWYQGLDRAREVFSVCLVQSDNGKQGKIEDEGKLLGVAIVDNINDDYSSDKNGEKFCYDSGGMVRDEIKRHKQADLKQGEMETELYWFNTAKNHYE